MCHHDMNVCMGVYVCRNMKYYTLLKIEYKHKMLTLKVYVIKCINFIDDQHPNSGSISNY